MKELTPMERSNNPLIPFHWIAALSTVLCLFMLPVQAYDQPWNGNREDITNPAPPPPPPCPGGDCNPPDCNNTSSPVYTADGSLVWSTTDIQFPSVSRIRLKRTYTSTDYRAGLFGRGWVTAQESNIARTYKAITEGNADGSPKTATEFKSVPIWLASYGRRYTLEETATACTPPSNLFFTFEKVANGQFRQVFENSQNYNVYSATGTLLESYSDREGSTIYYEYDSDNRLVKQLDSYGYALNFVYNDQGFVSEVIDHAQRSWVYSYDTYGRLTQVLNPDSNTQDYSYQMVDHIGYKQHLLTAVNDNTDDPVLSVTWANLRIKSTDVPIMRVSSYSESDGLVHDYSYAATTYNSLSAVSVVKKTRQVGNSAVVQQYTYIADASNYRIYSKVNNTDNLSVTRTYSDRGKLLELKDERGNLTRYEYDTIGNRTKTTELADTADAKVITYQYWNNTDRVQVKNEYGILETQYTYDSDLRVLTKTETDLADQTQRTWVYTYYPNTTDSQGNKVLGKLESIDGPRTGSGDTTRYTYNTTGQLIQIDQPLGLTLMFSYNSVGQPSALTDANNVMTEYRYNSENQITKVIQNGLEKTLAYNGQGQITQVVDELGRTASLGYDPYNNVNRIDYPSGDYQSITYNYQPTMTTVTYQHHKQDGTLVSTRKVELDPDHQQVLNSFISGPQVSHLQYNGLNELTLRTRYGKYNGSDASTDTSYQYDAEGRLRQITDGMDGQIQLKFDELDRLLQIVDPNTTSTNYQYTAWGEVKQLTSPDTGVADYQFDSYGNMTQQINANLKTTQYAYDPLNRLISIDYEGTALDVTLKYDEGLYGNNHLTSVTDGSGSSRYEYDDRGSLLKADVNIVGVSFALVYQYNDAAQNTLTTYPSDIEVNRNYDTAGRLSSITLVDAAQNTTIDILSQITWWGKEMKSYQLGNGMSIQADFDTSGRLISKQYNSSNSFSNALDPQGNIYQQDWTRDGVSVTSNYQYDLLQRLKQDDYALNGSGQEWTYDPVGNRLTQKALDNSSNDSYSYEANSNRLSSRNSQAIQLDAVGNMLNDGARTYRYNAQNRLDQLISTNNNQQADYRYNFKGERVYKQLSGNINQTIRYLYGKDGELLGEYNTTGQRIKEYVYLSNNGTNELVAFIDKDGKLFYVHSDHLSTPRMVSDQQQNIVWRWVSAAFGTGLADEDPDGDGNLTVLSHRFPGQYRDHESGLYYNYYRYYDPSTGRYITSDPIGLEGGVNTFGYAYQNPLMYSDQTGLIVWPYTDKHRQRNRNNKCPKTPPVGMCTVDGDGYFDENGKQWYPDDPTAAAIFHGGNNGFRGGDGSGGGSQCFYNPTSDNPVRTGGDQGTYDYSNPDESGKWDHFWDDVFPHFFDQEYESPDPTSWY